MKSSSEVKPLSEIIVTLAYLMIGSASIIVSLILISTQTSQVTSIALLIGGLAIVGWGCSDKIRTKK